MSRIDSSLEVLKPIFEVDNNNVICQAAESPDGHTVIILVTPQDSWAKKLLVSATDVFGYELLCGDNTGEPMKGLNANMKFSKVDLGNGTGDVAIQFLKPKTFGIFSDYGTLKIPNSLRGYTIAFFWPNDAQGDHWNTFLNNLKQTENAVGGISGVAGEVVKVGEGAAKLVALFA